MRNFLQNKGYLLETQGKDFLGESGEAAGYFARRHSQGGAGEGSAQSPGQAVARLEVFGPFQSRRFLPRGLGLYFAGHTFSLTAKKFLIKIIFTLDPFFSSM